MEVEGRREREREIEREGEGERVGGREKEGRKRKLKGRNESVAKSERKFSRHSCILIVCAFEVARRREVFCRAGCERDEILILVLREQDRNGIRTRQKVLQCELSLGGLHSAKFAIFARE